jgi:hypothetical protein
MKSNTIAFTVREAVGYFNLSIDSRGIEDGRTYPITVRVFIDDVYVGDTPITKRVAAGRHKLQVASIEATYMFEYWSDGLTENPRTINVDRDISLTAYFRYVVYGELSLDSIDQYGRRCPTEFYVDGKYVGDAPVTVRISGTHSLEARSKAPWEYIWWKWSDGVTDNPRSVNVSGYMALIAYYSYVGVGP